MSEKLREQLEQTEQKEKEPKVSYHFSYSPHVTTQDFKNLEKAFEKADIYVPEAYKWGSQSKSLLDKASQGRITIEEIVKLTKKDPLFRQKLKIIHNSNKPILLVDIQKSNKEFIDKMDKTLEMKEKANNLFIQGKFKNAIQKLRSYVVNFAKLQLIREKRIKQNLEKQIKAFVKQNPEYKGNKEIKVLVSLGSFHTHVYHKMKKEDISVSREFDHTPKVYISLVEAMRRLVFFKEEADDELLARVFIEKNIYPWLEDLTDNTNKISQVLRKISSGLTLKDIKQISKNISEISKKPRTPSFLGFPIEDIIYEVEKLGIKIPDSEQEMDQLLK